MQLLAICMHRSIYAPPWLPHVPTAHVLNDGSHMLYSAQPHSVLMCAADPICSKWQAKLRSRREKTNKHYIYMYIQLIWRSNHNSNIRPMGQASVRPHAMVVARKGKTITRYILYYIILYIIYYIILYYMVLYHSIPYYSIVRHSMVYHIMLYYIILCYIILYYMVLFYII